MTNRFYKLKLEQYGLTYIGIQTVPEHLGENLVLWNDENNSTKACKISEFMTIFP